MLGYCGLYRIVAVGCSNSLGNAQSDARINSANGGVILAIHVMGATLFTCRCTSRSGEAASL